MNVGIIGAGRIAGTLAETMSKMKTVKLYAVASRSLEKAETFAGKYNAEKAYGSYEELVNDPKVDLVYIATPHSHHAEHAELCINHKKPVLCEKAFTLNAKQAEKIIALARENGVFLAEAIWTRYMPSRKIINDVLSSGIIGKLKVLTANLSYNMIHKERILEPALAGGALLDVGVYTLNFAAMHFGTDIERIESSVQMTDKGVDGMESITIFYRDGKMAVLNAGIYARSDRKGIFYGENGYIVVENINNPQSVSVFDSSDTLIKKIDVPPQITGYEYELLECEKCLSEGRTESTSMPLSDTLYIMKQMDGIRKDWGLVYPQEK
ncbi:Gfo/Idh/MocA family protein [Treponema zioleckii]|uniref:Gfo/Idh/MocA family protein n=1 Tax=Treponema zioleckii TaxID=331680 RepID=UPI00168A8E07|nr:Gfo/Idh/MocA family oxidoreductase [Treponema zioleckii]